MANKNCLTYPLVDLIKLSQREYIFITLYVSPSRCSISDVLLRQLPQTPRNRREVQVLCQPAIKIQLVWGNYVRRLAYSHPSFLPHSGQVLFVLNTNTYIYTLYENISILRQWQIPLHNSAIRQCFWDVSWPSGGQSDKKTMSGRALPH